MKGSGTERKDYYVSGGINRQSRHRYWEDVTVTALAVGEETMSTTTACGLDRVLGLVDALPEVASFPTVDQVNDQLRAVAEEHPDLTRWWRVGTSRLGEPIHVLTISSRNSGGGPAAVVVGGVHPNEPIGNVTAVQLARTLTQDAALREDLGYTWHIVGCIDPDGMRLNEGWFDAVLDRDVLGRHFYRPPFDEQVPWTFPLDYKRLYFDRVLPETLALMRLFDQTAPTFTCGLHNGELGGAYFFLSDPAPQLYPLLHAIPTHLGVPLNDGEPELPFLPVYDRAIYGDIKIEDQYDYAESLGLDPTAGFLDAGSSPSSYTAKWGTFSLTAELPYWTADAASDPTPTATTYADVLRANAHDFEELATVLTTAVTVIDEHSRLDTPFIRAIRPFVLGLPQQIEQTLRRAEEPDSQRPATVAEAFTGSDAIHSARIRNGGMLLRHLQVEADAGLAAPPIRRQRDHVLVLYETWADAASKATTATTLPIKALVGVQLGTILVAADHARHLKREEHTASKIGS